jgi:hypothetical protein
MTSRRSTWRDTYKVHPAADLFPMMSDTELDALAGDIKTYGLREPIKMRGDELLDGRNRLEAAERIGWKIGGGDIDHLPAVDPVAFIISANIRRRHLTSGQLAAVLVKLAEIEVGKETGSSEPVSESKGGRGRKSPIKAKAVEINAALPEDQRVSESSIKRAIAKAEGKKPKPKLKGVIGDEHWNELVREGRKITGYRAGDGNDPPEPIGATEQERREIFLQAALELSIEQARALYAMHIVTLSGKALADEAREFKLLCAAMIERSKQQAPTLPQDGRTEVAENDPTQENDLGDIPACLDRRRPS